MREMKVQVIRRRFWWTACDKDEPVALFDSPTYFRSRTREGAIAKCVRANTPKPPFWEEVRIDSEGEA